MTTTVTVLALAAFGTYELLGGAGGGQGSNPVFVPDASAASLAQGNTPLQVQVIAQQWQFTFRYPTTAASSRRSSCFRSTGRWSCTSPRST